MRALICRAASNRRRVVRPATLYIDRRGETEVENRVDDAARRKERSQLGNLLGQKPFELLHVGPGRDFVIGLQRHHHEARVAGGVGRKDRREPRRKSDVGDNRGKDPTKESPSGPGFPCARQSCSVSSMRVPSGARNWMMNWPASVLGNNSVPSRGKIGETYDEQRRRQTDHDATCDRAHDSTDRS